MSQLISKLQSFIAHCKMCLFSLCSPTPSYRWVKVDKDDNVVDIRITKDIEFGNFNHTMTIYNIDVNHNGTYACIATIGANHDMVKWKLIVRGIC